MAMLVDDIRRWLETLPPNAEVAIDEGGTQLFVLHGEAYLEVGGGNDQPEVIYECDGHTAISHLTLRIDNTTICGKQMLWDTSDDGFVINDWEGAPTFHGDHDLPNETLCVECQLGA